VNTVEASRKQDPCKTKKTNAKKSVRFRVGDSVTGGGGIRTNNIGRELDVVEIVGDLRGQRSYSC